jgi:hypothetical protein
MPASAEIERLGCRQWRLLLGRLTPTGGLRCTGRTHPPSVRRRRELVPRRPEPLPYLQVEPSRVAEIEVDTAYEHHRWRHVRVRPDLSIHDVPLIMP